MTKLFPWWLFMLIGATASLTVTSLLFALLAAWAGFPSAREKELEKLLDEYDKAYRELEARCLAPELPEPDGDDPEPVF